MDLPQEAVEGTLLILGAIRERKEKGIKLKVGAIPQDSRGVFRESGELIP